MKTLMSILVGIGIVFCGSTAMAAYTKNVYGQWTVPWGETVTKTLRCPRIDVNGLGGELLFFLDGRATWVKIPNMTGVKVFNRQEVPNGFRATLENFSVYADLPDIHFSVIFQIILRCRYENPDSLRQEQIDEFLDEDIPEDLEDTILEDLLQEDTSE